MQSMPSKTSPVVVQNGPAQKEATRARLRRRRMVLSLVLLNLSEQDSAQKALVLSLALKGQLAVCGRGTKKGGP